MESIIWYNTDIFKTDIYYPHWFEKGIHCIGDLVKSSGKFFNMEERGLGGVTVRVLAFNL